MNLHKLSCKSRETVTDKDSPVSKGYLFGKEALLPVSEEVPDDMAAVAFVNGRIGVHKVFPSVSVFVRDNDVNMIFHGYL